jgi:ferredoxin-NADP reductase
MLPHKNSDNRGTRRYFTIASSPTEADVRVAMKIFERGSSFKKALLELGTNRSVIASQLAGDFVLPKNTSQKVGFIAGGIGITPFRSHIKFMIDTGRFHNTVLYYGNNTRAEIAYEEVFRQATQTFPFDVVHVIAKEKVETPFEAGYVNAEIIKRRSPDYLERHWYISGPPVMVENCARMLRALGVPHRHITKDFFPGLA